MKKIKEQIHLIIIGMARMIMFGLLFLPTMIELYHKENDKLKEQISEK